jgi:hypothetical protein
MARVIASLVFAAALAWPSTAHADDPSLGHLGDGHDPTQVLADSDWFRELYFGAPDDDEVVTIDDSFTPRGMPPYWAFGYRAAALVQMYDLTAPLDRARALRFLERLRRVAAALLANRDDHRRIPPSYAPPVDFFRQRTMEAWGAVTADRDEQWNTDAVTSGMFVYAMAAFARRVAEDPALQADCQRSVAGAFDPGVGGSREVRDHRDVRDRRPPPASDSAVVERRPPARPQSTYCTDAVRFTTAAIETYRAFLPEEYLKDTDPHAFFTQPQRYALLHCGGEHAHACEGYRDTAGKPLAYNENLSMMAALAETARAASSQLYRASSDATPERVALAAETAPRLIAKNVAYFASHLEHYTDGTASLVKWNHQEPLKPQIQDTAHANFEMASLAVIHADQDALNDLLARAHLGTRVMLDRAFFEPFANTFLLRIWKYDYQNPNGSRNVLGGDVDDKEKSKWTDDLNYNAECAGWTTLAQFNPWVWVRCRDAVIHGLGHLREDNVAALLRYRQ